MLRHGAGGSWKTSDVRCAKKRTEAASRGQANEVDVSRQTKQLPMRVTYSQLDAPTKPCPGGGMVDTKDLKSFAH